ncbi:MAG TPA: hypothetical protein VJ867_12950 [Gemmatimonadaceae bacterium]|nr:hypothetical protein [Gemmatimonadaceae bacterium]
MRTYRAADGTVWGVNVVLPGSSNAMVIFRHPDGQTSRKDRYNWFISTAPEARSVTSRLSPEKVLKAMDDVTVGRLFARSMPVSRPAIEPNLALGIGGGAAGLARGIGRVKPDPSESFDPETPRAKKRTA